MMGLSFLSCLNGAVHSAMFCCCLLPKAAVGCRLTAGLCWRQRPRCRRCPPPATAPSWGLAATTWSRATASHTLCSSSWAGPEGGRGRSSPHPPASAPASQVQLLVYPQSANSAAYSCCYDTFACPLLHVSWISSATYCSDSTWA